jgi:hypothetical protein
MAVRPHGTREVASTSFRGDRANHQSAGEVFATTSATHQWVDIEMDIES